jgi:16S rRNA (adenine(1408)-N(1))-methyltransferase
VIVDVGTGDGRAVLARAAAEPGSLVIGIDANAAAMAESSRRAARRHGQRYQLNAFFLVDSAEALPGPLAGVASLITITMPWGSLLRGVLGLDASVLNGIAALLAPGGRVEVIASVTPSDNIDGMAALGDRESPRIAAAWDAVGLDLASMRPAALVDLRATRSSWARRLGDRPVWRLEFVRTKPRPSPPRAHGQDARH